MKNILILFFLSNFAFSQIANNQQNGNLQTVQIFEDLARETRSSKINATGSPYVQNSFSAIKIDKLGDKIFSAKFNAYRGEMHIQKEKKLFILDQRKDYSITFLHNRKIYKSLSFFNIDNNKRRGFLVVLSENEKFSLYKREVITFRRGRISQTSYDTGRLPKFNKQKDEFYIKIKNQKIKFLPTNKKKLLKTYKENNNGLKSFLSANKISLKEEEDLIKLANFLSTL